MQTNVQPTSMNAYHGEIKHTAASRQKIVLEELLKRDNASNMELAGALGWSINTVTPRIYELRALGKVEEAGKRACKVTGRTVIAWAAKRSTTLFDTI